MPRGDIYHQVSPWLRILPTYRFEPASFGWQIVVFDLSAALLPLKLSIELGG